MKLAAWALPLGLAVGGAALLAELGLRLRQLRRAKRVVFSKVRAPDCGLHGPAFDRSPTHPPTLTARRARRP
jgi:hypothetical protein